MRRTFECSVCGRKIGYGPSGGGLYQHSEKHKREFRDLVGRDPESYEEVREVLRRAHPTIEEAILEGSQTTLPDHEGDR